MIYDLHNDILTAASNEITAKALAEYETDHPYGIIFAIWTTYLPDEDKPLTRFNLPTVSYDARFAIEDLGGLVSYNIREILDRVHPAYVSLTWNGENSLAGGCGCDCGLTDAGIEAIRYIAESGAALDLSHLSDKSFFQALDYAVACGCSVIVSHSASRALANHPRCITDEMAKQIAAVGGIIGVAAVPNFLDDKLQYGETCHRSRYTDHIYHLCEITGTENVAIGTDFFGTEYYPDGLGRYSDFELLRYDLLKKGLSNKDINAIFCDNVKKFFSIQE